MGTDFNGDGRDDILWRHRQNDTYTDWLATANGGFVENSGALFKQVSSDWNVVGAGDFNGDGRDDILWRHQSGAVGNWLGNANGGFLINDAGVTQASTGRYVAGTGDFNGDGRDDILWREFSTGALSNWQGNSNGGFSTNAAGAAQVPTDWNVVGTGDFNGDGRDDILWRNDNGATGNWLGNANGGYFINSAGVVPVPNDWNVAGTGDFNGDGRDDVLWRTHDSLTNWLGQANGGFVGNDAAAYNDVDFEWFVQPNPGGMGWWDY